MKNTSRQFKDKFPKLFNNNDGREGYDEEVSNQVLDFILEIVKKNEEKINNSIQAIENAVGTDYEILNLVEEILNDK